MNIRRFSTNTDAVKAIANELRMFIEKNDNPLWLMSGGSNIPVQVQLVRELSAAQKKKTTVSLVDERCGNGSNFAQLKRSGFDFGSFGQVYNPNLHGDDLKAAAKAFNTFISGALRENQLFVQLGFGGDGHVAGLKPPEDLKEVVFESKETIGIIGSDFERISLTESAIVQAKKIVIFASGERKNERFELLTHAKTNTPLKDIANLEQTNIYLSEGA